MGQIKPQANTPSLRTASIYQNPEAVKPFPPVKRDTRFARAERRLGPRAGRGPPEEVDAASYTLAGLESRSAATRRPVLAMGAMVGAALGPLPRLADPTDRHLR